jgi:hypothetical protein
MQSSSSNSSSSRSSSSREKKPAKFIPNIAQLQEVTKDLPDPELYNEDSCVASVYVNGKNQQLEFTRKRITRGKNRPYRWIYEGKILIRKQDVPK